MEESEAEQEIEALKAIWPELQDRPRVWNSPSVAIPVCPLGIATPEGATDADAPPMITLVVIFNPRYPKVPPRLELEHSKNLTVQEVAELKHLLETKANEMSGTDMVMVHELLVSTNEFLSDGARHANKASRKSSGSLFQKMQLEEQRQRKLQEEEERLEETRQREEEARILREEHAKGQVHWAVVRQKLEQERESRQATTLAMRGASEGVIQEGSGGYSYDEYEDEETHDANGLGSASARRNKSTKSVIDHDDEDDDDDWMNDHDFPEEAAAETGVGTAGGTGAVRERRSWYRSQFKELENLGKGGFGTVVKVRNRVDRRLYAVKKVGLDPFDKETNRKIRREVTTISKLVHKNIVRYYQAWLEGGGGAIPAAVEEGEQSDDAADDHGRGSVDHSSAAQSGDEHGEEETDSQGAEDEEQSEAEEGLRFFRTQTSTSAQRKSEHKGFDGAEAAQVRRVRIAEDSPGGVGNTKQARAISIADAPGGHGTARRGRAQQRKAKRLERKQARERKRALKALGKKNGANTNASEQVTTVARGHGEQGTRGIDVGSAAEATAMSASEAMSWAPDDNPSSPHSVSSVGEGASMLPGKGGSSGTEEVIEGTPSEHDSSWGSDGGDYRPCGQGRLVSDAEFFQYFGSPETTTAMNGFAVPPLPASWSSEDALLQIFKHSGTDASPATKQPSPSPGLPDSPGRQTGLGFLPPLPTPAPPTARMSGARAPGGRQFLYIQMEYCENTLRHLIDNADLWREEPRIWKLFRQMLEGVDFIHSQGIIHRDLTPPNVFLDGEENVKLGDFGLATSKKAREKIADVARQTGVATGAVLSSEEGSPRTKAARASTGSTTFDGRPASASSHAADSSVSGGLFLSISGDTSQLTDGVGTGPYIAPEQGSRLGQYNHKADMWSLGVILFEMLAPRFSTLMERAEAMTALRSEDKAIFPPSFEQRVPDNAKQVIRWLLKKDAAARPTAAELLSSALLPPKLEVEAAFLREALRVMGNPDSESFRTIVKSLMDRDTAEHVEHWYDREPLRAVSAQIPQEQQIVSAIGGKQPLRRLLFFGNRKTVQDCCPGLKDTAE